MKPVTCTRRLEFDAAHRVPRHESKCRTLHGHRYVVEITAQADHGGLDACGRVIDFGVLKERVGGWLDREWDHTTLVDGTQDAALADFLDAQGYPKRVVRLDGPPTAEVMAQVILHRADTLLAGSGVSVVKVRLYETPNCYAEVEA